ncbi:hypothetical protein CC80DRAFT_510130 [Byssothecium circinans]|uniref:Uncharacterized protein n=1 Tax=Byssothecium circinans TaxID=147558 RepID=A0A6A5TLW1_9PLEO|nr:hypothetical protein CC80DRAFT_510130 [Byssothecium circinans]
MASYNRNGTKDMSFALFAGEKSHQPMRNPGYGAGASDAIQATFGTPPADGPATGSLAGYISNMDAKIADAREATAVAKDEYRTAYLKVRKLMKPTPATTTEQKEKKKDDGKAVKTTAGPKVTVMRLAVSTSIQKRPGSKPTGVQKATGSASPSSPHRPTEPTTLKELNRANNVARLKYQAALKAEEALQEQKAQAVERAEKKKTAEKEKAAKVAKRNAAMGVKTSPAAMGVDSVPIGIRKKMASGPVSRVGVLMGKQAGRTSARGKFLDNILGK